MSGCPSLRTGVAVGNGAYMGGLGVGTSFGFPIEAETIGSTGFGTIIGYLGAAAFDTSNPTLRLFLGVFLGLTLYPFPIYRTF